MEKINENDELSADLEDFAEIVLPNGCNYLVRVWKIGKTTEGVDFNSFRHYYDEDHAIVRNGEDSIIDSLKLDALKNKYPKRIEGFVAIKYPNGEIFKGHLDPTGTWEQGMKEKIDEDEFELIKNGEISLQVNNDINLKEESTVLSQSNNVNSKEKSTVSLEINDNVNSVNNKEVTENTFQKLFSRVKSFFSEIFKYFSLSKKVSRVERKNEFGKLESVIEEIGAINGENTKEHTK